MGTALGKDLPAYVMATGNPAAAKSINVEGLRRRGFDKTELAAINQAYKTLYRRGLTLKEALAELEPQAENCAALRPLIDSIKSSSRGILR